MKALDTYSELLDLLKSAVLKITKKLPHRVQILQEAAMAHVKAKSLAGIKFMLNGSVFISKKLISSKYKNDLTSLIGNVCGR